MAIQCRDSRLRGSAGLQPPMKRNREVGVGRGESPRAWEWGVLADAHDNKSAAEDWVEASFPVRQALHRGAWPWRDSATQSDREL